MKKEYKAIAYKIQNGFLFVKSSKDIEWFAEIHKNFDGYENDYHILRNVLSFMYEGEQSVLLLYGKDKDGKHSTINATNYIIREG